ncbi:MAG: hypothetical protein CFE21_06645 [Bacteroidetes bacterium B1(2017)]|nr:MAG: hypothetical protein CFE21_06645 [Bacteroidetes bacterium B1(2017)]
MLWKKNAKKLRKPLKNNLPLKSIIPYHEVLFYGIVLVWGLLRYHYFKSKNDDYAESWDVPNFPQYDTLLQNKNPYYAKLSMPGKLKFISRIRLIREELEFQGREDFEITEEVKVLLCASITQLTFGFNSPTIPMLKGVVVFPSIFYSRLTEAWVKGLAMGNGVVFLSWDDFINGYKDSSETYNLGLHEFAHILRLQALESGFSDERLSMYFEDWEENGTDAFEDIREGSQEFFREYGGTNKAEFFSVCIENFFEVPQKFEEKLPDVYWHLCYLMKQNPLNYTEDFNFDRQDAQLANEEVQEKIPEYDVLNSKFEYNLWQFFGSFWFIWLMLILIFQNFISSDGTPVWARMSLICVVIGLVVRIQYYQNFRAIQDREYLYHLFLRVIPVSIGISLFYQVFFS